ncbi:hypothetical protein [Haloarchaeobius sp. DYHT-AS-18]|uniref:hypothetical protein n=1 Tax=Haloarchaeobius sp. DYHT-AS-18 TaxID=3446117 RepID=UPI003EBDA424
MSDSNIRYYSYPRTEVPPDFAEKIVAVFRKHESIIGTENLDDGLKSNEVLKEVRDDLMEVGFEVESGKGREEIIERPVLFGEDGEPELQYEVDGYHPQWRCGLEVEAGRAWKGNAIYRDLIQALVMVQVDTLVLAVPNVYKYGSNNQINNRAFDKTKSVLDTLYSTHRFEAPYDLILIGY